jgi:hypothetical protein
VDSLAAIVSWDLEKNLSANFQSGS